MSGPAASPVGIPLSSLPGWAAGPGVGEPVWGLAVAGAGEAADAAGGLGAVPADGSGVAPDAAGTRVATGAGDSGSPAPGAATSIHRSTRPSA